MTKIRQLIYGKLFSIHPRVYFQTAPENAQMPYLVYDITSILDDGEWTQTVVVDIDGWDNPVNGDTTPLETLMETVNLNFNKTTEANEELAAVFYLDRQVPLQDDDKRIKRRKYIYECRLFERS